MTILVAWLCGLTALLVMAAPVKFVPTDRAILESAEDKTSFGYAFMLTLAVAAYLGWTALSLTSMTPKRGFGFVFFGLFVMLTVLWMVVRASSTERTLRNAWLFLTTMTLWFKAMDLTREGSQPVVYLLHISTLVGTLVFGVLALVATIRESRLRDKGRSTPNSQDSTDPHACDSPSGNTIKSSGCALQLDGSVTRLRNI